MAKNASSDVIGGLVLPIYLDVGFLLDLLATIEGGFAMVEQVTTRHGASAGSDRTAEGQLGAPSLLGLLKLSLTAKSTRSSNSESTEERGAELTHTHGSLLHRLLEYLSSTGLLGTPNTEGEVTNVDLGEFIQIAGVFRPNPFTAGFRRLERMLDLVSVAGAASQVVNQPPGGQGKNRAAVKKPTELDQQIAAFKSFFQTIAVDVEREGTQTVVMECPDLGYQVVTTLFSAYLRDRSMAELLNREYILVGKVVRNRPYGAPEGVDLLSASGVAGFGKDLMESLSEAFATMQSAGTASVQKPIVEVLPPVLEILPIAIFI